MDWLMDGWMEGWRDGRTNGRIDGRMDDGGVCWPIVPIVKGEIGICPHTLCIYIY